MDLLEDSLNTTPKDPDKINRATAKDKKALGLGALLFAGAAFGYLAYTLSGQALVKLIKKQR